MEDSSCSERRDNSRSVRREARRALERQREYLLEEAKSRQVRRVWLCVRELQRFEHNVDGSDFQFFGFTTECDRATRLARAVAVEASDSVDWMNWSLSLDVLIVVVKDVDAYVSEVLEIIDSMKTQTKKKESLQALEDFRVEVLSANDGVEEAFRLADEGSALFEAWNAALTQSRKLEAAIRTAHNRADSIEDSVPPDSMWGRDHLIYAWEDRKAQRLYDARDRAYGKEREEEACDESEEAAWNCWRAWLWRRQSVVRVDEAAHEAVLLAEECPDPQEITRAAGVLFVARERMQSWEAESPADTEPEDAWASAVGRAECIRKGVSEWDDFIFEELDAVAASLVE